MTEDWIAMALPDVTPKIRAELRLPRPATGDLDEFEPRYAAAERAAWRYHRAMSAVTGPHSPVLAQGWAAVIAELNRAARLLVHGAWAPATGRRSARHDPSRKLSRRQRLSPRDRHLHQMHCSLVALEQAADTAVRVAVATALARPDGTGGTEEVDAALVALAAAVDELTALTRDVIG
jgi:hypothetical protein